MTAADARPGLSGVSTDDLTAWLAARSEPAFRARQVLTALWAGSAGSAGDLTTLPKALAAELDRDFRWSTVADETIVESDAGQTGKALHRLSDGATIESVLMHYPATAARRARH